MAVFTKDVGFVDPYFGISQEWFDKHIKPYNLTLDACASPDNNKLPRWWGIGGEVPDAFGTMDRPHTWGSERLWCAPPWEYTSFWIRKALQSPQAFVVMLIDRKYKAQCVGGELIDIDPPELTKPRLYPDGEHPEFEWALWIKNATA